MHELYFAKQILNEALRICRKNLGQSIKEIHLELGGAKLLNPTQLTFSFNIIKKGTLAKEARLVIIPIAPKIVCECGYKGEINSSEGDHFIGLIGICPKCNEIGKIVEGYDCIIKRLVFER